MGDECLLPHYEYGEGHRTFIKMLEPVIKEVRAASRARGEGQVTEQTQDSNPVGLVLGERNPSRSQSVRKRRSEMTPEERTAANRASSLSKQRQKSEMKDLRQQVQAMRAHLGNKP